jgi:hypothetical protein
MFNTVPLDIEDVAKCVAVMVFGLVLMLHFGRRLRISTALVFVAFAWHTLISIGYLFVFADQPADMKYYFESAFDSNVPFAFSTGGIIYAASICVQTLGMSFLATNLLFSISGALGMLYFYAAMVETPLARSLRVKAQALLLLFLPSTSFWSACLGKDGLAFLSVGLFSWSLGAIDTRKFPLAIAVGIMVFVRPHIAFMMLLGAALLVLMTASKRPVVAFSLSIGVVVSAVFLAPIVLNLLGVESLSISDLGGRIEKQQGTDMGGGTAMALTDMSLPALMASYLFRPLPNEITSSFQILIALENLVHIFLFLEFFALLILRRLSVRSLNWGLLGYAVGVLIFLAATTSNLGIAVRQKWMVLPAFYTVFFTALPSRRRSVQQHPLRRFDARQMRDEWPAQPMPDDRAERKTRQPWQNPNVWGPNR